MHDEPVISFSDDDEYTVVMVRLRGIPRGRGPNYHTRLVLIILRLEWRYTAFYPLLTAPMPAVRCRCAGARWRWLHRRQALALAALCSNVHQGALQRVHSLRAACIALHAAEPRHAQGSTNCAERRVVTDWLAPAPGVGVHRYIWLAFKGSMANPAKCDQRICWDLSHFMEVRFVRRPPLPPR